MPRSQTVLITGCSSGIGRATAEHLAARGHIVYATARRPETIADLEARGCRTMQLDVTQDESMRAAVESIGTVDALVNNAGYGLQGPFEETSLEDVRRQFETNVFGPVRLAQLVLPAMRAQGWGKIVNIGSMGGRLTFPGGGYYHATKYAMEALSDALRFEVAGFGVHVVLVEPGFIRSGFSEAAASSLTGAPAPTAADDPYRAFTESLVASTRAVYDRGLLARLAGSPDDVANVVLEAVTAERPRARYPVTASARVLLGLRRLLSDRAWDRVLARQFVRPGRRRG